MAPNSEANSEKPLSGNESACPVCGTHPFFGNICSTCVENFKQRKRPDDMTPAARGVELASLLEDGGESGHKALGAQMFYQRVRELVGREVSEAEIETNGLALIEKAKRERAVAEDPNARSEAEVDAELQKKP